MHSSHASLSLISPPQLASIPQYVQIMLFSPFYSYIGYLSLLYKSSTLQSNISANFIAVSNVIFLLPVMYLDKLFGSTPNFLATSLFVNPFSLIISLMFKCILSPNVYFDVFILIPLIQINYTKMV